MKKGFILFSRLSNKNTLLSLYLHKVKFEIIKEKKEEKEVSM